MPDISMVHVDQALTNVSIAYHNAQFIADHVPADHSKQDKKSSKDKKENKEAAKEKPAKDKQ